MSELYKKSKTWTGKDNMIKLRQFWDWDIQKSKKKKKITETKKKTKNKTMFHRKKDNKKS